MNIMDRTRAVGLSRYAHRGIRVFALACLVLALLPNPASDIGIARFTRSVNAATTTPLLLMTDSTNTADPFGPYLGEILRAEGFPSFASADLSTLSSSSLTGVGVLLLGPVATLSTNQVTTLTTYVQGGGNLITMRPPTALASQFGLTPVGTGTSEAYMKIGLTGLGTGFTNSALQFHGAADNYTLSGATNVATLYSSANAATPYPAVAVATLGQGQAQLWTYDLAQSVVFTRQGNPSHPAITNSDGGYRTTDLFSGYVDLNDVPIPQADEQQRLLTKTIAAFSPVPLPHLWYFPANAGTVLVLTGDAHANPTSYYTNELASIGKYGGHITFYLSQAGQPTATDVTSWKQAGNSVGIHPYPTASSPNPPTGPHCGTTDGSGINAGITNDENWFRLQFGIAPSATTRVHQVAWQCWTDVATDEANAGIAMNTDYYAWGSWLKKPDNSWAHGFINGSGLPMQMVDASGKLIPVYQQETSLVDEQLIVGTDSSQENLTGTQAAAISRQLIDASLTGGNYAALLTQFHVDYYASGDDTAFAEGTMAYAQSKGVPIWSADEWLRFTKARAGVTFGTPGWDGTTMTLPVNVPSGPDAMPLVVPLAAGGSLTSIAIDGSAATYQARTIKGAKGGVVMVSPGSHTITATYSGPPPDTTPPTISLTAPTSGAIVSGTAVPVSANATDNIGVASVQFLLDGSPLGSPVTAAPFSIAWDSTKTTNANYTLSAQATDAAGNVGITGDLSVTVANPPQFSAITASNVQITTATVSWTTNVPATSQVEYGPTTAYGNTTTLDSTLTTSHSQGLTGLAANTIYHYRVRSTDAAGNAGASGDFTFTTAGPPPTLLVGDQNIEANQDNNPAGTAEAYQYTATTTGTVDKVFVYIDGNNTATQVVLGVYANTSSDNPGTLLAQATIANPAKGAWNNAAISPIPVTKGTKYWIAILGPAGAGTVQFRDTATGGKTQSSAQTNLGTLPATWSTGGSYANSPLSAYAVQSSGTLPPPDTTPPTISLTAPANGATVSGTAVTVSATAMDNVGVTSVQFLLDGIALGAPLTASPYSITWDTTKTTNATHTLSATAKDAAGNTGTATNVTVTVSNGMPDTTPPTISLTAPANGATVSGTAVTVSASATDNVGVTSVQFTLDGMPLGSALTASPYSITWDTTTATNATHTLSATAKDAAGNTGTAMNVTVTVMNGTTDATPPTISLTAPANGATVSGTAVTVSATAMDNVGVTSVQFLLDGTPLGSALTASPYSITWDTTTATNTSHTLSATAKDAAGNTGTAANISVTVSNGVPDTTPPTISLTAPANNAMVSGTAVTVSASATDNVGVTSVQFTLDGMPLGALLTTAPYSITWDTTKATNTTHTLSATAKDAAGNTGTAANISVTVANGSPDTTPPTVSLTAPANGATVSGTAVTVSGTAMDNVGVTSVQFTLDGTALGALLTASPYSITWNTTTATNGSHTLSATAKDAAGNTGTATNVTVTVANPPTISAVSASGITATGATIKWTTNTAATSQVDYGTSTAYGTSTTLDPTRVTSHSQALSGLTASTTYHYRVRSTDAQGNTATSGDFTFSTTAAGPLLGTQTVGAQMDNNPPGTAEAFQATASTSGTATKVSVYIDGNNTATQVIVGIYTDTGGNHPGTLLAQTTIANPTKGGWNTVTIPSVPITSGTKYWIAILGPVGAGTVQFRDVAKGGKTEGSAQTNLTTLPMTWTTGGSFTDAPLSAYLTP